MKEPALLFDLDGTLVDSVPDLTEALAKLLGERNAAPLSPEEVVPMVGAGTPALVARGLAARGLPEDGDGAALARFLELYEAAPARLSRVYAGVPETLAALRDDGWRLGIVTNKPFRSSDLVLKAFGLASFFGVVVAGDTTPWKKPDPRPLYTALAALGAEQGIFIGDNENDAAAAHAAGLALILLRHGYAREPVESLGAAALLDRFDALPAALAGLARG